MKILIIIVALIMFAGLIGTIAISGNSDENYDSSTKGNITRLTMIYILLTVGLIVGVGLYIVF